VKKALIAISLLGILLLSANEIPIRLVRLTIVNKSGLPLEIRLTSEEDSNIFYYLRVDEGDRSKPAEKVFTILAGRYQMQPYYIELWDPVYGYSCSQPGSQTLYAERNIKVTILECDYTIPRFNLGEPSIWKYSSSLKYIY
jgi:hypothetical protein